MPDLIERLARGPEDARLTPDDFARLYAYVNDADRRIGERECFVPDTWSRHVYAMHGEIPWQRKLNKLRRLLNYNAALQRTQAGGDGKAPMTDLQSRLWAALEGRALTGKELASPNRLNTSEECVRSTIREMRKAGHIVKNRRGRGYFRADSPPSETFWA